MAGCVAAKPASSASSKKNTVKQNAVVLLGIALPGSLALLVIRSIPLSQSKPWPRSIMAAAHRPETAATVRISRHGREGISYPSPPGILTKVLCIRASEEEAHERDPYPGLGPRALVVAGRACRGGPGLPPRARPCAGGSRALRTRGADAGDHAGASPGDRTAPRRRVRCCDAGARRSRADVARRPDPRGARAHAAVDRRPVARRRAGDVGAAGVGVGNDTAAGDRGNAAGLRRLAVAACGDARVYATALLRMEQLRAAPALALGAGGGSLLGRVRRLLAPATPDAFPRWLAGVFGGALALAVAIGSGWGLHRSLPASADSLIALATGSRDPEVRHDAVKELGQTKNPRARMTLIALAQSDPDDDVRDEAVESLGAAFPDAQTVRVLAAIARRDPNEHVMREAVETLGRMKNSAVLPVVIDIARTHPDPTVRREAVKSIRDEAPRAAAVPVLRQIARRDRDPDVHRKAVRALAKVASVSSAAGGSRPAPPASRGA